MVEHQAPLAPLQAVEGCSRFAYLALSGGAVAVAVQVDGREVSPCAVGSRRHPSHRIAPLGWPDTLWHLSSNWLIIRPSQTPCLLATRMQQASTIG
jgi:hypothetical protein